VRSRHARIAVAALGLDPGLGFIHMDTPARDSLGCDVLEAVRPNVDSYVLNWVLSQPLRREWFFEQRNGNCRVVDHSCRATHSAIGPMARAQT
jgi:CRISPR/Cas system-associated endonuclease Cas1